MRNPDLEEQRQRQTEMETAGWVFWTLGQDARGMVSKPSSLCYGTSQTIEIKVLTTSKRTS